VVTVLVGSGIAHYFHKDIIRFILKPISPQELVFLSPLDPLFFILNIDLIAGVLFAFPVIVWLAFSYIKPAITERVTASTYAIITSSATLVLAGIAYAYLVTVPLTLRFLSSLQFEGIQATITAQNYLSFFLTQTLIIAFVFQIPLFILFGILLGMFSTRTLGEKRGYIYIGLTVLLAILTPTPDIFSLGIILLPALTIFEGSLIVGRIIEIVRKRRA
jgi:sec-independent protein translocase protein TatC